MSLSNEKYIYYIDLELQFYIPITDIIVNTAVSAADTASCNTEGEQDSMEVIEKPIGWYLGLIACNASFKLAIFEKIFAPAFVWDEDTGTTDLIESGKKREKFEWIWVNLSKFYKNIPNLILSWGGDIATSCTWTSPLVEVTLLLEVDSWRILGSGADAAGQALFVIFNDNNSGELGDVDNSLLVGKTDTGEVLESGTMISDGEIDGIMRLLDKSTDLKCLSLHRPQTASPIGKIMPFLV